MAAEASDVAAQAAANTANTQASRPLMTDAGGEKLPVHDRLKMLLGGSSGIAPTAQPKAASADESQQSAPTEVKLVPEAAKAADDQAEATADDQTDDAQSEERQFSNLAELLEAGGLDLDKGGDLSVPVKIDGKEGTATLRELVKSYQLDGHHHAKLAQLDTDRKTFQGEQRKFQGERADKLLKLDAGVRTLERSLMGEFQQVDWNRLAADDPVAYNAKRLDFQDRNANLQAIAGQIAEESQQQQAAQVQAYQARLDEERRLMLAKIPEWGNEVSRQKDRAEIGAYLASVGITQHEFEAIDDHRYALVARDAWKWNSLQKSKPAMLNKVKAAPKLLKPGTQQSKDAINRTHSQKEREALRQSGKVQDAVAPLKRFLFK